MNKIELVNNFFDSEKLQGTRIFYGSCIEDNLDSKDVDCCIITEQKVDKNFYIRYKNFLLQNGLILDEEVKYEDKLILSKNKILHAIRNYPKQNPIVDLNTRYPEAVDRLIVNIFTTKTKVFDDNGIYNKLSDVAWKTVLQKFKSLGGKTFSDFIKIFQVNKNYKKYWGYTPRVLHELFNRFYQHKSTDTFIKLLKKNVITHPYKIAVFSSERNLTYKDLDIMSDNIAKALLKFNSKYVIVNYPHSFELIPIVYGILKAGKVYIPVDYTSSNLEINNIKKKFNNYIYLSDTFSDVPITKTINLPHQIIDYLQNEIAYIIHTSGTTGQPKGVCISRKNLNYILNACQTIAPISKNDCYLFSTRNTFDVSITEMFSFLYSGGSAFVYSVKSKDFYKRLPQAIEQYHITHIALSPSVLSMLLKYNNKDSLNIIDKLKYLIVAGEEFKTELLEQVNKKLFKVNILNVYGPTETTVYATSFNVRKTSSNAQRVPIGSPLPGVKVLIQNNELLIGGEGVSLGYFNDSQKTKQAFEKINNQLFYHTGDIVKKENHNIIYLDRKDNQIQIYGIRVELGDIRSLISKVINDSSRELEVTYENKILTLYYTGKLIPNLRKKLEQHIVSYKIPTRYINLPSFPLTSSGKIDRKKLTSTTFMKPVDSLSLSTNNSQIFNIVKKSTETILNQSIEPNDNLLNSGLDSLNSIELILSLEQQLNINLDNLNLYSYPSINKITSFIENTKILSSSKTKSQTNNSSNIQIKNIPINQKIEYTFPAYFYAKIYHSLNFNSKLYGRIFLGKHRISYEEIYHKLSKVEVFKTILSKDLSTFEVLDTPINISKFQVNKARTNLKDKLKNAVDLSINRHGLLYKFVYLEDENEAILYYSIDHSICDTGSLDALERYILGVYDESTNYSKYINEVFKHNTLTNVLKELDTFNTQNNTKVLKILSNLENKISFVNLHFLDTKTKNIYSEILIFLKNKLLEAYDIDKLKVNLIFNIRKFDNNIDYSSTIGDLHIGLTYLLKKDIDVAKELDNLILQYKNKMFNPKAIGYKHFPNMNSNEKKIIKCFDDTVYVSIDYLGIVSADDFKKIKKNIKHTNREINKLNSNKLNITAYIVDNTLKLILSKCL